MLLNNADLETQRESCLKIDTNQDGTKHDLKVNVSENQSLPNNIDKYQMEITNIAKKDLFAILPPNIQSDIKILHSRHTNVNYAKIPEDKEHLPIK